MSKTHKRTDQFLLIVLVLPTLFYLLSLQQGVTVKEASAAEKSARLDTTEIIMGFHHGFNGGISIEDANEEAEYTYESSNKKIVTVKKELGWLDDVSKGSAMITVTETLDGKSRELGKVKVTVVGASLDKEFKIGLTGSESSADILVPIKYQNYSAKYIYQSDNPNIVEVTEDGNMYSKKLGSTYISVTEKFKGKITKLGKIKVNVVNAEPRYDSLKIPITPLTDKAVFVDNMIAYRNPRKDYVFISSNKKILVVDGNFGSELYGLNYGTAKIDIYEVYQGKRKKIGTTTVEVAPVSLDPECKNITVEYNSAQWIFKLIQFDDVSTAADYSCEAADSDIISVYYKKEKDPDTGETDKQYYLKGLKKGKTTLTVYEEYKGQKKAIGTVNATVQETIWKFTFDPDEFEMVDGMLSTTFYLDDENPYTNLSEAIIKEPYEDMSAVSFSSIDENVVKLDSKGNITLVAKGTAVLKATCEDWSTELKMTVE